MRARRDALDSGRHLDQPCRIPVHHPGEEVRLMAGSPSKTGILLARLVVVLTIGLIVLGAIWYGFSVEVYQRVWRDILERPGGPMTFRFFLQPTMAAVAAIHDGINDAHLGRSPYFWAALHDRKEFGTRLREGLLSTARIILLGLGMDVIYQHQVLGSFYPGEAVLVALLLAVIPYLLVRGPAARIARRRSRRSASLSLDESGPRP
jgi:hypothetical protein